MTNTSILEKYLLIMVIPPPEILKLLPATTAWITQESQEESYRILFVHSITSTTSQCVMFGKLHGEPQNSSLTSADNPSAAAHFVHCRSLVHWLPNSAPYTAGDFWAVTLYARQPWMLPTLGSSKNEQIYRDHHEYSMGAQQRPSTVAFFRNPQKDRWKYILALFR